MTSITIPEKMDEKTDDGKTSQRNGMLCAFCVLSSLITLLLLAAFTWYIIVDTVPPCSDKLTSIRSTDVNFNRRGKLYGTDIEFEEDSQYVHAKNTLISRLAAINGHHARMDNATIIHDFTRGVTARVLPTHKKCYLGALEIDDSLNLPMVTDGDVQNLQSAWPRHHYMTMGPIAPEYLDRTAGPVVRDYCTGLQTSWITPTPAASGTAANSNTAKKRAVQDLGEYWTIVGLPDGAIISDMTNRMLLRMYGHI